MNNTTKQTSLLKDIHEIVSQCDRCGTCRLFCPLYKVKNIETFNARGKVNIARALAEGGLDPTPDVMAAVNFCLLCRTCVDNCPSKIKTDEAMIAARQYLADVAGGISIKHKMLAGLLKRRNLVKLAASAFSIMRQTKLNRVIPQGMVPANYTRDQFLAAYAGPAVLGSPAAESKASLSASTRVAFFHGCGMRMMFPDATSETIRILKSVGDLQTPDNECCGLPHLAHGLREDFLALAKENIRLFFNADVVVCDCASCSSTLKHLGKYFADDSAWKDKAEAFAGKIMDLTEYLVKVDYQPRQRTTATMTFHEPCHLGRGQSIRKQPRQLLKAAGNFVDMPEADACCGGAGSFHLDYPDVADALLEKKMANIIKSGAEIVVTECPGCLAQMTKIAEKSGGKIRALHISQVI
jgi:glycolate oxidase iron-sulfur subunit